MIFHVDLKVMCVCFLAARSGGLTLQIHSRKDSLDQGWTNFMTGGLKWLPKFDIIVVTVHVNVFLYEVVIYSSAFLPRHQI